MSLSWMKAMDIKEIINRGLKIIGGIGFKIFS